jgi:hypothetical protein
MERLSRLTPEQVRAHWQEIAAAIRHDAGLGMLDAEMVRELFAVLGNRSAVKPAPSP